MHFDANNLFSDKQEIRATGATNSTNRVVLGSAATPPGSPAAIKMDLSAGVNIPLRVQVVEDFADLTSLAVALNITNEAGDTTETIAEVTGVPLASLKAGAVLMPTILPAPPGGWPQDLDRLTMVYTVTGTAPTSGAITAGFVEGHQFNG